MNFLYITRSLLRPNVTKITSLSYVTRHPVKFMETEERWRQKDNVPKHWNLIYKAPMGKGLNYITTYLTFSTTTIGLSGLYYAAFVFDKSTMNDPVLLGNDIVIANSAIDCLLYLGAFVALHVAVKVLLSKYVLRLYQNGDNYLAIFGGHIQNQIRKYEFHLKDFQRLKPALVVSWGNARFSLGNNKQAIILENYFKTPEYFNYLITKRKKQIIDDE